MAKIVLLAFCSFALFAGCDSLEVSDSSTNPNADTSNDAEEEQARLQVEKAKAELEVARAEAELQQAKAEKAKAEAQAAQAIVQQEKNQPNPVQEFKNLANQIDNRLQGLIAVKYNEGTKSWSRFKLSISAFNLDVKNSDSLIKPYTGQISFNVGFNHSGKYETAEQAKKASGGFTVARNLSPMIAYFTYKDGHWHYVSAEANLVPGSTSWRPVSGNFADPVASTIADLTKRTSSSKP